MDQRVDILKGIHPGKLMERDIRKMGLNQRILAERSNIPYQTINAIIAGRRNLTTSQALNIEHVLGYEEGFLLILQAFHDIKNAKDTEFAKQYPDKPNIRKILFWDIDYDQINWGKYKNYVIKRVLERGNSNEVNEIMRFYGLSEMELNEHRKKMTHEIA